MTDRTRAERALAFLVHQIRDEWDEAGIVSTLRKITERPLADVTAAAIYCATKRTDQRTPACIALDGEHWQALDRMGGKTPDQVPPYLADTRCPRHGEQLPCLACQREARGTPATPERIREIRQAARQEHQ